jgi:DNA polymerase-3 subunit epsilon
MLGEWRFKHGLARLSKCEVDVLSIYAAASWPSRSATVRSARFLALDFELDGLRSDTHLLQAGWIPFTADGIDLGGARVFDIQSARRLDDRAVTIHGIGEQRARQGAPLSQVIEALLQALAGRVIVAHGAAIEREALQRAVRKLHGVALPVRSLCTLAMERQLAPNLSGSEAYRLGPCRQRRGLPAYAAHDALTDALAAGELFLAQLAQHPGDMRLGTLEGLTLHH